MNLTEKETALFIRRTVLEPDLVEREFSEAMAAMMAQLPANMRPSAMPTIGTLQNTSGTGR